MLNYVVASYDSDDRHVVERRPDRHSAVKVVSGPKAVVTSDDTVSFRDPAPTVDNAIPGNLASAAVQDADPRMSVLVTMPFAAVRQRRRSQAGTFRFLQLGYVVEQKR